MERWAENTLRAVGIALVSAVMLIGSGVLLLLSICASGGSFSGTKHPEAGIGYLLAAIVVFGLGVYTIVRLARGFFRSSNAGVSSQPGLPGQLPAVFTLTPEARRTIQVIVYLMIAKIVAGYIGWMVLTQTRTFSYTPRLTMMIAMFFISQLPFIILGAVLLLRPSAAALTFTLVFTTISVLNLLPSLQILVTRFYSPGSLAVTVLALLFEVAIIAAAFKALQKANARLEPVIAVVALAASLIYFFVVTLATPVLYRLR